MQSRTYNKLVISLISVIILIFILYLASINQHSLVVFDTFREMSNTNLYVINGNSFVIIDWGMYLINGLVYFSTGLDLFSINLILGIFLVLLTSFIFFLACREISKDPLISCFFTLVFVISYSTFASAFYYRPQTFALFAHVFFFYVIIKANKSDKFLEYLGLTFLICLFSIYLHKTTKILPFIFLAFWIYYCIKENHKFQNYLLVILSTVILFSLTFYTYSSFFSFYLFAGSSIDPSAFSQEAVPISDFFLDFGGWTAIIFLMCFLVVLSDLIFTKKKTSQIINEHFESLFSLGFLLVYLSLAYLLPNLSLISVNVNRFDILIVPFLLFFTLATIYKSNSLKFKSVYQYLALLVIFGLTITSIPHLLGDVTKYTSDKYYYEELTSLKYLPGDLVLTTFTSSSAIQSAQESNQNYSKFDTLFISGYHYWGSDSNLTSSIRNMFYSENESAFHENLCSSLIYERDYISSLPIFPQFVTPNLAEKRKINLELNNQSRILVQVSLYDQKIRGNNSFGEEVTSRWWNYRTTPGINISQLEDFPALTKIYESENIIIFEYAGRCH